ncbi:hydroxyisourate hydrolase [Mycobacterium sp. KBS0706]|jgi:5-hydroxyisourate hydrolase|uniref:hydroxyisourate hydrolase n=1 Tax=Mycobacterium sp. KBS0706 TaxID=2578109 RepID=UPI00110FA208|nr:hydroxyisourate hydrolase [Mycobacterium sp. KBS0706]TSD90791.1 hydroxyisourate hydrolase [Mycobacterium sp. KBS0706]
MTTDTASHRGRLTTHVLDTAHGRPGMGIAVALYRLDGDDRTLVTETRTNADGRCDAPLMAGDAFRPGRYELVFDTGAYFRTAGVVLTDPPFLDQVPIRVGIAHADQHYHVPLLISPWSYSTYRGS